jgi:hypothetical protein
MRKIPFAIVTLIICIFSALIFASCDTNPRPQDGVFPVNSAEAWNSALSGISKAPDGSSAGNPAVFVIDITGSFSVPGIGEDGSSITGDYKEVRLTGGGTMFLSGTGSLILVSANQTFIIDGPTLQGTSGNNMPLVFTAGKLELRSGYITGNKNDGPEEGLCGGVGVNTGGIFTMTGGEISGNSAYDGGGVVVYQGTFTMNGGVVSGNTADFQGGGIFVYNGIFTMDNGTVSGNTGGGIVIWGGVFTMNGGGISNNSGGNGGGVRIDDGSFTMNGGGISVNTADNGGGVFNNGVNCTFTMTGGTISGNIAVSNGGGVYAGDYYGSSSFSMTGGVIYGTDAVSSLKNTAGTGAAVYISSSKTAEEDTITQYTAP